MPRMTDTLPELLCDKHLLGEHYDMHIFAGNLAKGRSVAGFVRNGKLNPALIWFRHRSLSREMENRGMNHDSPLPLFSLQVWEELNASPRFCENCDVGSA